MDKLKNHGAESPLFVHHGLHLSVDDVASMSDVEIRTLINTVTNVHKTKKFTPSKSLSTTAMTRRSPKIKTTTQNTAIQTQHSFARSLSIDSVRSNSSFPHNDESPEVDVKKRPFSISAKLEDSRGPKIGASTPQSVTPTSPLASAAIQLSPSFSSPFRSFLDSDAEHARADELLCLAERAITFRPLFQTQTEDSFIVKPLDSSTSSPGSATALFLFEEKARRILVRADRFSTRSASMVAFVPSLHREMLDILAAGALPECTDCAPDKASASYSATWSHPSTFRILLNAELMNQKSSLKRSLNADYCIAEDQMEVFVNTNKTGDLENDFNSIPVFLWAFADQILRTKKQETLKKVLAEFQL